MALQDAETLMAHMSKEAPALLNRLYKAAKAYYLMKEEALEVEGATVKIHNDLVQEEMAAALVAVKMITENVEDEQNHSLVVKLNSLSRQANRTKEWWAAKVLAGGGFKPGKSILLEPGETIEFEKTRLP